MPKELLGNRMPLVEPHNMEHLSFDDDGEPICMPIGPKKYDNDYRYIELRLCGYNVAFGDKFSEHFERIGLEKVASGQYPDGSRWYRYHPRKFGE
jgi:hypothetical protein